MKRSVMLAVIAVFIVALWLLSGQFDEKQAKVSSQDNIAEDQLMTVEILPCIAQPVRREIVLQGQLLADEQVVLRAETAGRVEKLFVDEGDSVEAGQLILQLQENGRKAQIAKANAAIEDKKLILLGIKKLNSKGLQSESRVKQAEAELASAYAEQKKLQLDLQHTVIRAPFAGALEQRKVTLGSFVDVGDSMIKIVAISRLTAQAFVPQQLVGQLHVGQDAQLHLLDGRHVMARLGFVSKDADQATRSFRVEAGFDNTVLGLQAGMSVEMRILADQLRGHKLATAILTLNEQGELGVKAIDESHHVIFYPIEKIKLEDNGIWVAGLPETVNVITRGQDFVLAGDKVNPQYQGQE